MGRITLDQSHQIVAALVTNTDWDAIDFDALDLQNAVVRDARTAGAHFTAFLQAGARMQVAVVQSPAKKRSRRIPRFDPAFIGKGWTFWRGPAEGDGLSGEQEKERSVGRRPNLTKLKLETCLRQGETYTTGEERRRRLSTVGGIRGGADQFRWFWEHQDRIPAEWEEFVVYFDDTVLRSPRGDRFSLYLYRDGGQWDWGADWLGYDRDAGDPSLLLAE